MSSQEQSFDVINPHETLTARIPMRYPVGFETKFNELVSREYGTMVPPAAVIRQLALEWAMEYPAEEDFHDLADAAPLGVSEGVMEPGTSVRVQPSVKHFFQKRCLKVSPKALTPSEVLRKLQVRWMAKVARKRPK